MDTYEGGGLPLKYPEPVDYRGLNTQSISSNNRSNTCDVLTPVSNLNDQLTVIN